MVVSASSVPGQPNATLVESRISPETMARLEQQGRQKAETLRSELQSGKVKYAELVLSAYYKDLDRSLKNGPGLRSGYWPQGRYNCRYRIEGKEFERLQQLLVQLKPVPLKGRPLRFTRRDADPDAAAFLSGNYSSIFFELQGESARLWISDPAKNIVKASALSSAMKQMDMKEVRYYLPDADYAALMALPSFRKAYADKARYKNAPGAAFESEESAVLGREVAEVRDTLPQLSSAMVLLQMGYPQPGDTIPLLAPYRPKYYMAAVNVDQAVLKRYNRLVRDATRPKLMPMPGSMPQEELQQLGRILAHLEPVPVRYLASSAAAPRSSGDADYSSINILLEGVPGKTSARLHDIGRTIVRKSELKTAAQGKYGDVIRWVLPDAEYAALMALPSIRRAYEWKQLYRHSPADFFFAE